MGNRTRNNAVAQRAALAGEQKIGVLGFVLSMHRARQAEFERSSAVMARHGLTPAEYDVLSTLERAAERDYTLTPTDLQAAMLITSGGLTKVLRQLEQRRLIARSQSLDDRRVKPVRLQAAAVPIVHQTREELFQEVGRWLLSCMSEAEMAAAVELLDKVGGRRPLPKFPAGL